ncbi:MAG: hypothetical protein ACEPOW_06975, partial [Bacteroidales bacterium]
MVKYVKDFFVTVFLVIISFVLYFMYREELPSYFVKIEQKEYLYPSIEILLISSVVLLIPLIFKKSVRVRIPTRINIILIPILVLILWERYYEQYYFLYPSKIIDSYLPFELKLIDYPFAILLWIIAFILIMKSWGVLILGINLVKELFKKKKVVS